MRYGIRFAFVAVFSFTAFRVASAAAVDWPGYNNDPASTRYSTLATIARANVRGLHRICSVSLGSLRAFESGPIGVGGIVYVTTGAYTFAIDGSSCRKLWTNAYAPATSNDGPNRGVAYASGRLFRGTLDGHVLAIDAKTGRTIWNRTIVPSGSYAVFDAAPIVANGLVVIGSASGDGGEPGVLYALDPSSGAVRWSVRTVPTDGSAAANASWSGATHIAGGTTWTSYTYDATTDRVYASLGNPGPDFYGDVRKGANLPTDTLAAFDALTGKNSFAVQVEGHDVHDYDLGAAPALAKLASGAAYAIVAGKDGYVRAIDTGSGRVVWSTADTTISNTSAPIVPSGTHFCPGLDGGTLWNGPAYSARTKAAYVDSVDRCSTIDLATAPPTYVPGRPWLGSSNGYGAFDASATGHLTSVDAATGRVRWTYHAPTPLVAGVTATAGGLVFAADLRGTFYAFNDTTGALLKTVPLGLPVAGGIATYGATTGKQFVAVAAGDPWGTTGTASATIEILGL